ncbi:MAG: PaaI family thioesterase [Gemmatimonadota bacterium]|nr:PaaI family thioesterase [Gemmatimonadota bacterium]
MDGTLERVRRGFAAQGFMRTLGAELEHVEAGECHIAVRFSDELTQQHGLFHGGVTATLADNAAAGAGYSLMSTDEQPLTVEFKINFVAPARGDGLVGKARVLRNGRRLKVVESKVFARDGGTENLVAAALATIASTGSVDAPA